MKKQAVRFLKKVNKPVIVIVAAIAFFFIYTNYIVDRSLINIRAALVQANNAKAPQDFQKIKELLKIAILKEMAKSSISDKTVVPLELAVNIIDTAKNMEHLADAGFYLRTVAEEKQSERRGILALFDRINMRIFAPETKMPEGNLKAVSKALLARISSTKDEKLAQKLYFDLGNIYVQSGDIARAEGALLKSIQALPGTGLALKAKFNLAWALKTAGQYEKSLQYFKEVGEELASKQLPVLSRYEIADIMFKKGDYRGASNRYGELSDEYPDFDLADLALFEAGSICYNNIGDRDKALEYFEKLQNKYPKAKVVKHVETQVRLVMSADFREEGFRLLREGKYSEAIAAFQKAVRVAPADSRSMSGLSLGLYWTKEQENALNKAKEAVKTSLEDEVAVINSTFVLVNSAQLDEAIKVGLEALEKRKMVRAEFFYNLGNAYLLKSELDKAIVQFRRAIKLNPDFPLAYNNLGCALWSKGMYSEAIKKFKDAIIRDAKYADPHFNLGVSYLNFNRLEDAYREFDAVLRIKPDDKQAQNYIAKISTTLKYKP